MRLKITKSFNEFHSPINTALVKQIKRLLDVNDPINWHAHELKIVSFIIINMSDILYLLTYVQMWNGPIPPTYIDETS